MDSAIFPGPGHHCLRKIHFEFHFSMKLDLSLSPKEKTSRISSYCKNNRMNRNATDAMLDTFKTHSQQFPFVMNHSKTDNPHRLHSIQSKKQSTGGPRNLLKTISTNEFSLKKIVHGNTYKMVLFMLRLLSRGPTLEPLTSKVLECS